MANRIFPTLVDALIVIVPIVDFNEEMFELLLFAVTDLRSSLKDLGSNLMVRLGRTESVIQELVKEVVTLLWLKFGWLVRTI